MGSGGGGGGDGCGEVGASGDGLACGLASRARMPLCPCSRSRTAGSTEFASRVIVGRGASASASNIMFVGTAGITAARPRRPPRSRCGHNASLTRFLAWCGSLSRAPQPCFHRPRFRRPFAALHLRPRNQLQGGELHHGNPQPAAAYLSWQNTSE